MHYKSLFMIRERKRKMKEEEQIKRCVYGWEASWAGGYLKNKPLLLW